MADSTKGTEEKGLGEEEQSLAVVVAPEPTVPPEDSFDSNLADEDDEYSLPSDPCPSPSPKRRKKGDGEEGDEDYLPPKEGIRREKIPITVKDWDHVSNGDKEDLWKELKLCGIRSKGGAVDKIEGNEEGGATGTNGGMDIEIKELAIAIPGKTYNEEFIPDAYAKVQPQVVHEGFESYDIDFPTQDGVSVLGDKVDLGKPPRPHKREVTDKAEEPEMHKENPVPEVPPEIAVPEVPMEIQVADVPMEITVVEPEVQFVASVKTEIEEVPGLEWDSTEPEIFEDPSPAKDPEVQETMVPEKATTSSEVPRVLRSHDSKSKDENKEKFMVTVFRGGKERAKLRDDDSQKAAELAGPTYLATDDCPEKYEHGKALLPDWALNEGPWEMRRLHTFYMDASKKDLGNITARSLADCFGEEGYIWLDFSDLHAIYRRDKMDVNYVGVWCMMQYMDAKKKKEPIGFLDPTRIYQTQHTVRLAPGSDQLKGKTPKEIAEYKKGLHKEKLITVAQYIGRAFLHFQNKRVVMAAYNFKVNGRYRTNTEDLPRLEHRTSFDDTGIKNIQRDLCHFIHHECCHVKGDFFDPEGALATSDEFKDLRERNLCHNADSRPACQDRRSSQSLAYMQMAAPPAKIVFGYLR
uniref:Hydroxyproline-rich glycoprotein-like n=1 Tax=Oryza glaberrima TaxID=4538 RepID=I1PJ91_ORYGL